jgi:peptidyl-prolyl cis-trans isomerase SurA
VSTRRILRATAFSLILVAFASSASARLVDGVVAVVNDEPITFSEFRESVAEAMGIPEGDADIYLREEKDRERVLRGLETLIESVLVHQELQKLGNPVTEKEVDDAVASVMKTNNMSEDDFRAALAREGVTPSGYRRRIRWQLERGAIVRAKKFKEVTVTEEETKAYFTENAERFLVGAEVRLETLYLPFPVGEAATEERVRIRIAAQQASDYLRSGMTFAEVSRLLSSSVPEVSVQSSGFLKTEDLLPEIAKEVHRLRTGATSPPIFTDEGAHLIRVLERRGGVLPEFAAVKASLTEELVDQRSEKAYAEILVELKKAATIEIHL